MDEGEKLREVLDGLCGSTDWEVYETHGYCLTHAVVIPFGQPCPVTLAAFRSAADGEAWRVKRERNSWRESAERRGVWLAEVRKLAQTWRATPDAVCCAECQRGVLARQDCGDDLLAALEGFE